MPPKRKAAASKKAGPPAKKVKKELPVKKGKPGPKPKAKPVKAQTKPKTKTQKKNEKPIKEEKLVELTPEEEDVEIPREFLTAITNLTDIQDSLDDIYENKRKAMEKIAKKYRPDEENLFEERREVVSNIENFWQLVFAGHPILSQVLEEIDWEICQYMQDLDVKEEDNDVLTVSMVFNKNPFFTNQTISKTFTPADDSLIVTCNEVKWKDKKFTTKNESSFFVGWADPEDDNIDVANLIREEIWTDPLCWYYSVFESEDEFEDEEDEEDDEIVEEDDEIVEEDDEIVEEE